MLKKHTQNTKTFLVQRHLFQFAATECCVMCALKTLCCMQPAGTWWLLLCDSTCYRLPEPSKSRPGLQFSSSDMTYARLLLFDLPTTLLHYACHCYAGAQIHLLGQELLDTPWHALHLWLWLPRQQLQQRSSTKLHRSLPMVSCSHHLPTAPMTTPQAALQAVSA